MDSRVAANAHPAFVEIINQMTGDEANIIRGILQYDKPTAIVEIRQTITAQTREFIVLIRNLLTMINKDTKGPMEWPGIDIMVDNWVRLGLVEVDYAYQVAGPDAYDWLWSRPEVLRLKGMGENVPPLIEPRNGLIQRTSLGVAFAKSVGLID